MKLTLIHTWHFSIKGFLKGNVHDKDYCFSKTSMCVPLTEIVKLPFEINQKPIQPH